MPKHKPVFRPDCMFILTVGPAHWYWYTGPSEDRTAKKSPTLSAIAKKIGVVALQTMTSKHSGAAPAHPGWQHIVDAHTHASARFRQPMQGRFL